MLTLIPLVIIASETFPQVIKSSPVRKIIKVTIFFKKLLLEDDLSSDSDRIQSRLCKVSLSSVISPATGLEKSIISTPTAAVYVLGV